MRHDREKPLRRHRKSAFHSTVELRTHKPDGTHTLTAGAALARGGAVPPAWGELT